MSEESQLFHVVEESGKFEVLDPSGRSLMTCRDTASAEHYATLLNQAYKRGYKDGYREAKSLNP
ncbi:hypothetical protein [Stieleria mannarensis]|uniref:hypothetical protein n=1 Tax=Stieleria mannarensis TaxID=2755585 RepID=UPI0016021DCB|nr:hypothetical protein [Rhodopirellula sp. JC639]